MALIKCTECGKDVSDKAAACPGCGAPLPVKSLVPDEPGTTSGASSLALLAMVIAGIGLVGWAVKFWIEARSGT